MGIDILGIDIVGVDILGIDIPAPTPICVAKTKTLISFAVTAKLICVFAFAYAKSLFSHDAAHM